MIKILLIIFLSIALIISLVRNNILQSASIIYSSLIISLLFYLREYGVWLSKYSYDDSISYLSKLSVVHNMNIQELLSFNYSVGFTEPLYILFLKIYTLLFGANEDIFLFLSYFFPIIITLQAIRIFERKYYLLLYLLLLFSSDFYNYQTFHLFRQSLAFSVAFYGLMVPKHKNRLILLVCASLIHYSLVLFLLHELILRIFKDRNFMVTIIFTLVMWLVIRNIAFSIVPAQYLVYRDGHRFLFFLSLLLMTLFASRSFTGEGEGIYKSTVLLLLVTCVFSDLFQISARLFSLVIPLFTICLAFLWVNNKWSVVHLSVLVVISALLYTVLYPNGMLYLTSFKYLL